MAIQPNKPQNRVFLLVGIVLAVLAAGAVLFTISKSNSSSSQPTASVVVAKSTIAAGTAITADLVTTAPLVQGTYPADSFTDPAQVVGKLAPVTLSANIPLTASLFASGAGAAPGVGVVPHLDITKGYVAIAIPAGGTAGGTGVSAELVSAGYYIQPEDHIDILIDTGTTAQPSVRFAFQDVRVLRVGVATAAATTSTTGAVTSYIIELPRNQAELLTALTVAPAATATAASTTLLKYVLRPEAEWGKRDGANGFDKPNYVSNTGTPVPAPADATVTSAMLNILFGH